MIPSIADDGISVLDESFPHVVEKMIFYWGEPEFYDYTSELLCSDRPFRTGFPFSAVLEINAVIEEHKKRFPDLKYHTDIWVGSK